MLETIRITMQNRALDVPKGIQLQAALRLFAQADGAAATGSAVLACMSGGRVLELSECLQSDTTLVPLTYQHEEGRRLYERSLRFLFLASMKRLFPGMRVRMQHSVGHGLYIKPQEGALSHEDVRRLEADMHTLVSENLPFEKEEWTRQQAISYFEGEGWLDKAELLRYRPKETIPMYRMAGLCEYFYGAMLPSTGMLTAFQLKPHHPGVVLSAPSPENPDQPAPYVPRKKFLRVFDESQRWCSILGARNVSDVNRMIKDGKIREFIRVSEALHDRSIAAIADDILKRQARIVMIFGPSSSGKTTFANRLAVHLRVLGQKPHLISLDDFYRNRADLPLEADGTPDLECLESIDVPLFNEQLVELLAGREVELPRYSFQTKRREAQGVKMRMAEEDILLVEGIHGLNDALSCDIPSEFKFRVYVSALTQLNLDGHNRIRTTDVRLMRRMVRDHRTRATSAMETMQMWDKVRAGEEKYIFPFQEKADVMFNTSLLYEIAVLKKYAYPMLKEIGRDSPYYTRSRRLGKFLHYFKDLDEESEIPPISILREFIGGSSFYRE